MMSTLCRQVLRPCSEMRVEGMERRGKTSFYLRSLR
jgi:hypothetical protein